MKTCPSCGLRYPADATQCFVDRAKLVDAPDPYVGTLIGGRYRVEALLGEGGMATVYRARHTLQERPVAIKVFRKELARDAKLRERFRREATSTARLAHPHIIEIMDSGEAEDGAPYLVMELLEGESLETLMGHGPVGIPRAVNIVLQVLGALARAHDFQVLHRDLKPDNLFVCRAPDGSDFVKILDFGIARSMHDPRLTGTGEVFGTPQYMAPERITSIDTGPAADLYAMGVILFELATGALPFESDDIPGYLLKHLREPPPHPRSLNPQISTELEALILKLLEKDPTRRPHDAHLVITELSAIAAALPRPQPAPRATASIPPGAPTPYDGIRAPKSSAATLAPATLERWERRVTVFTQMMSTAFPGGARADLAQTLERVRSAVSRLNDVRHRSLREQAKLEAITTRTRDAQGRFGHAMDALGQDLSRARQELGRARDIEKHYAEQARRAAAPFLAVHAHVVAAPRVPAAELQALYRQGLEALDQSMGAMGEHGRAVAYLQAKEREATDTDFQIQELRAQLARLSQGSEDERGGLQKSIEALAAEGAAIEQKLIQDASALVDAMRGLPSLRELFSELEADAA